MALLFLNLIPFVLAVLIAIPAVRDVFNRRVWGWISAGVMAFMFGWLLTLLPEVTEYGAVTYTVEWVPALGLSLSWYVDGLALMFALIVTGIGIAVFLYTGYYMEEPGEVGRFYAYMFAFSGSMLSLVTAGNIVMLFIAWEGTSIMSFLLIGFKGAKSPEARTGALRALIITGSGGLTLLVAMVLLGIAVNDINDLAFVAGEGFELATILNTDVTGHSWYIAIAGLVILGALTKSAQFPFHFWLPGAMTAPSPASAYLHSATMVKAGIYLLFRLYPTLGGTTFWYVLLASAGLVTLLIGALFAIRKRDLKALLAYSTVSKLGAITALIALPDGIGLKGAAIGIIAHALYKATFFLLAGAVEHSTHTRNLDELGGLRRLMPGGLVIASLVGLSMAGFPPLIGFVAKELLVEETLRGAGAIPVVVVVVASILTVVAALLVVWDTFIRNPDKEYHHFHAPEWGLMAGPGLLAVASLIGGPFIAPLLDSLIDSVVNKDVTLYLLPPVINPLENEVFALSLIVLVSGVLVFSLRGVWMNMPWFRMPTGDDIYAQSIKAVDWMGDRTLLVQNGKVRYYLVIILGVVSVLMLLGGYENLQRLDINIARPSDFLKVMLLLLTIGATLASIILRRHLIAALALGVSGYAIGGIFLLEPAPDVALVQFLIETLATVLIILMIQRISMQQRREIIKRLWQGRRRRLGIARDALIATVIGVSVGLFALEAVQDRDARIETMREVQSEEAELATDTIDITRPITLWHLQNAYPETGVEDVVSAILADFRGTDTLIEITVFATAALGVLTLLTMPEGRELMTGRRISQVMRTLERDHQPPNPSEDPELPTYTSPRDYQRFSARHEIARISTPLTRVSATLVLPFALLISISHVLYGGSGPGDGFTAGVVSGLAVALWYVVFGYFEARARLSWLRPGRVIALGLILALANAALGLILADGFLAPTEFIEHAPADLHLSTTLIFEFAIYLTVFGSVTAIMSAIAHPHDME